jgi:type III secretion protein F
MNGLSFSEIANQVGALSSAEETNLQNSINAVNANTSPTTADLLTLQSQMQEWSMAIELQSTLVKTASDTMKGIIQKSS